MDFPLDGRENALLCDILHIQEFQSRVPVLPTNYCMSWATEHLTLDICKFKTFSGSVYGRTVSLQDIRECVGVYEVIRMIEGMPRAFSA